jgi:hypothetical protein
MGNVTRARKTTSAATIVPLSLIGSILRTREDTAAHFLQPIVQMHRGFHRKASEDLDPAIPVPGAV